MAVRVLTALFIFFLATGVFFNGPLSVNAAEAWHRVDYVFDGDTIKLDNGTTVRYLGVNAPEIKHKENPEEPFGNEAREENRTLVGKKKVRLEFDKEQKDQYGRLLAYVYLEDGRMVNRLLIEKGLAWALFYRPNIRYERAFSEAQTKAISENKGIWQVWKTMTGPFIGNEKSKRFHEKNCQYATKIGKKNRVVFNTGLDAFKKGYSPCKHCINRNKNRTGS